MRACAKGGPTEDGFHFMPHLCLQAMNGKPCASGPPPEPDGDGGNYAADSSGGKKSESPMEVVRKAAEKPGVLAGFSQGQSYVRAPLTTRVDVDRLCCTLKEGGFFSRLCVSGVAVAKQWSSRHPYCYTLHCRLLEARPHTHSSDLHY